MGPMDPSRRLPQGGEPVEKKEEPVKELRIEQKVRSLTDQGILSDLGVEDLTDEFEDLNHLRGKVEPQSQGKVWSYVSSWFSAPKAQKGYYKTQEWLQGLRSGPRALLQNKINDMKRVVKDTVTTFENVKQFESREARERFEDDFVNRMVSFTTLLGMVVDNAGRNVNLIKPSLSELRSFYRFIAEEAKNIDREKSPQAFERIIEIQKVLRSSIGELRQLAVDKGKEEPITFPEDSVEEAKGVVDDLYRYFGEQPSFKVNVKGEEYSVPDQFVADLIRGTMINGVHFTEKKEESHEFYRLEVRRKASEAGIDTGEEENSDKIAAMLKEKGIVVDDPKEKKAKRCIRMLLEQGVSKEDVTSLLRLATQTFFHPPTTRVVQEGFTPGGQDMSIDIIARPGSKPKIEGTVLFNLARFDNPQEVLGEAEVKVHIEDIRNREAAAVDTRYGFSWGLF